MERIPYEEMRNTLAKVLQKNGFTPERASLSASLFADASRDGVYSHGLNRFSLFLEFIRQGHINAAAECVKTGAYGCLERWDGQFGPGMLNAHDSMARAIELSKENGVGCVALKNTNHWMRGANYGWQAADAGCIGICWTNTTPNMPPWGSDESKIGNNPIVFAVPRHEGHIVLDTAISQFSYGQLQNYMNRGQDLPVDGGFDPEGKLTKDPAAIMETKRALPIGYWKGSGLSLMLDLIAMLLSGGSSTLDIGKEEAERGVSQVFLAFDLARLPEADVLANKVEEIIGDLHAASRVDSRAGVRYPGEETLRKREDSLKNGIPVDAVVWKQVLEM